LARKVAEIAALPIQQKTIALWKANNAKAPVRPMVMIDQIPWHEMDVDGELEPRCDDPFLRKLETELRRILYRWKHMPVDFVVEPFIRIPKTIHSTGFGIECKEITSAIDVKNDIVGHAYTDQITTDADVEKIHAPELTLDVAATERDAARAHEIFDGILEVRVEGSIPVYSMWDTIVMWRNPEAILYDLVDRPEFLHKLAQKLTDASLAMLDSMEKQSLLGRPQSWIHCTGAFTDELPAPGYNPERPRAKDLWTYGMSQIFSSVSPEMHEEFEHPYLAPWFERFGLVYYGCCEPLDHKLPMIRRLPNVRKISMSPWVDVERGAEAIGRDFVFSRKPSPAFLAMDNWDIAAVASDLRATRDACRRHGCPLELMLKDISTLRYQPKRLWEWAALASQIVRE
jgi:hypothetical protein